MEAATYIDGDILPYRVGFVTERMIYCLVSEGAHSAPVLVTKSKLLVNKYLKKNPDLLVHTSFFTEEPMQAIATLQLMIKNIIQGCRGQGKRFVVCMSGTSNFRDRVATIQPYKGNRVGFEKPYHFDMLREWLMDKPYTIVSEDEEADDLLSRALLEGHTIATIDKDLNNTPGTHYNLNSKQLYEVSEDEARRNFYTQFLVGDTADHIPGIKGIGPKKAEKLFEECDDAIDYENVLMPIFKKEYGGRWFEALTEVGRLLWMRREENEMWHPVMGSHMLHTEDDDGD
jgi:hypothetical protein